MNKQRNNRISLDEAEARKYGLSYGVYSAYKETGYLKTYIENQKKKKTESGNIIESNIIGASGKGYKSSRRDQKLC